MGVSLPNCRSTKKSVEHVQDQDSSSSQSTGQSHSEMASFEEDNPCKLGVISGSNEIPGKLIGEHNKSLSTFTSQGFFFPSQLDFSHSMAHVPSHHSEKYFGGKLAAHGPQAPIMGMTPGRAPLPVEFTEDEPIYVNAKQYCAILRRRQFRAKLEAQNKLIKVRKPYLHESRHVHALKRARGSGGRFLNMKLHDSKPTSSSHRADVSESAQLHLAGNMPESNVHEADRYHDGASTTSCSDLISTSNSDDIFPQQDFRFSGYPSRMGGTQQVSLVDYHSGGNQQHVSIFR